MRKYTRAKDRWNLQLLTRLSEAAEGVAAGRGTVVLKTNATNRIDVRFKPEPTKAELVKLVRLGEARDRARQRTLVYCVKPQAENSETAVEAVKRRVRGRCQALTSYGAGTVREACAILKRDYGKNIAFITLTLPGSTAESIKALAEYSYPIQNLYLQRIRDFMRRGRYADARLDYVLVWEYQERGALHIHLAVALPDKSFHHALKKLHKKWWCETLAHFSDTIGVDLFERADGGTWRGKPWKVKTECNLVKYDVARYMSKYVSKGAKDNGSTGQFPPGRWWSVSKHTKDELVACRQTDLFTCPVSVEAEQHFLKVALIAADDADTFFLARNRFTHRAIGYTFFCNPEMKEALVEHLQSVMKAPEAIEVLKRVGYIAHGPPDVNGEVYESEYGYNWLQPYLGDDAHRFCVHDMQNQFLQRESGNVVAFEGETNRSAELGLSPGKARMFSPGR